MLQIVSAPGQQYLRPQGPVVMQTVSQAGTVQNALNALGNQHQAGVPTSTAVTQQGRFFDLKKCLYLHTQLLKSYIFKYSKFLQIVFFFSVEFEAGKL